MAERRRYTKKQKAAAVGLALAINPLAASEGTGIPRTTILGWMDRPEYDSLRQKTGAEMSEGFKVLANLAMQRLLKQIEDDEVDPKDVAVAMGIATEKYLLMSGEATSRTESTLLRGKSDHEQQLLADVINSELERRAYADAVGDQAADTVEEPAPAESGTT